MCGEPWRDRWHLLLEIAWDRDVQDPRAVGAAVLEVMRHATGDEDEGASGSLDPVLTHKNGRGN